MSSIRHLPRAAASFGVALAFTCLLIDSSHAQPPSPDGGSSLYASAVVGEQALHGQLLGIAQAGNRLVAVGDRGVIMLSDDRGKSWRQAHSVPFDGLLTSVSFADAQQGWAVGHGGVILHTKDGGVTWVRQRLDTQVDQPLFAVHFFDDHRGVAVGLWSLILTTEDGGAKWATQRVVPPSGSKRADLNLFSLFPGKPGEIYAVAERGRVLRSVDRGLSWEYLDTGYSGSLWAGIRLNDGGLLVGGLRGNVFRSDDDGRSWTRLTTASVASISGFAARGQNEVLAVALDGISSHSDDGGRTFTRVPSKNVIPLTGVTLLPGGGSVLISRAGPVAVGQ